jgi:16S rRNA (guanine966-N2)-methyltransferase
MRVIAGSAKGARLVRPPGGTRPMTDRAREGLFSSLGSHVEGAGCLDLFAGTGSLGIEALSRGAEWCRFVDRGHAAVRAIRTNLSRTGFGDRARISRSEAIRFLERTDERYDLVLVDPPWTMRPAPLRRVVSALPPRLTETGLLVLSRPSRASNDVIPVHFGVERRLVYGDTLVLVCREGS